MLCPICVFRQPPYTRSGTQGWYSHNAATGAPAGELDIVPLFAAFSDLCFKSFGDRVKTWITFNEAWTFTWLGSGGGKAPGLMGQFSETPKWPLIAGHNVLLAHAAAADVYRRGYQQVQGGKIAITNNMEDTDVAGKPKEPKGNTATAQIHE